MADQQGYAGQEGLTTPGSPFNQIAFMIQQMIAQLSTMKVVEIMKVTNAGELAAVGFVDVKPMVSQVDGLGNATPHGTVYNIPYFRLQGGTNAIIMDPVVGDIGFVVVSDRDISTVKAEKKAGTPGSFRRYDLADGVYVGGILNAVPEQYVTFTTAGIKIADKNGNVIEMKAGAIELTATALKFNGTVIFGAGAVFNLLTHVHPTAALGPPSPPTPGS